eukprot:542543_1
MTPQRKICNKKKKEWLKKSLTLTQQLTTRIFSLIDVITDLYLLYSASRTPSLWFLSATLLFSMTSPYIISYSSGIQLHLLTGSFEKIWGSQLLLLLLFLLPSGILYYMFLDFMDILLHFLRWINFVWFCIPMDKIEIHERNISHLLKMDKMGWEGFKQQRMIGQLTFESLPQFIIQIIVFYFLFDDISGAGNAGTSITNFQLAFSILTALFNVISTLTKISLEAKCCKTGFVSYALQCIKGRNDWVPLLEHIVFFTQQSGAQKIDFKMPFQICGIYTYHLEFEFDTKTIGQLMNALLLLTADNNLSESPNLTIYFHNTLHLLPFQDIIDLYSLCQSKNIHVASDFDLSCAIQMSKNYGKDPGLLQFSRDDQGMSYILKKK